MMTEDAGGQRKRGVGRQTWREKSHQESHAGGEAASLGPLTAHPLAGSEPPEIVTTQAAMAEMVACLKAAGSFAFDSEFIGERSYQPQLCLMQTATAERVFVIDALTGLDLSGLWELVVSPEVEKIVLAGQQDFGPAVMATGRAPANIMDLQIAAGFVQADYPLSLARVLADFVGVSVGKALTFTHWDKRPLSAMQVRYAADDVRYLPAAREAIAKRLAEMGRIEWAREECRAALEDMALYAPAAETLYLRVRRRERLGRGGLAVLRELAVLRDVIARSEDVPPRTMLKDEVLIALARYGVTNVAELDEIRGLPRSVEARYGRQIVEATQRGMAVPEERRPMREPEESPAFREHVDNMLAAVGQLCAEKSVAPALVASRKEVARACRAVGRDSAAAESRLLRGWRRELLGGVVGRFRGW